jgi:hypothetical protein
MEFLQIIQIYFNIHIYTIHWYTVNSLTPNLAIIYCCTRSNFYWNDQQCEKILLEYSTFQKLHKKLNKKCLSFLLIYYYVDNSNRFDFFFPFFCCWSRQERSRKTKYTQTNYDKKKIRWIIESSQNIFRCSNQKLYTKILLFLLSIYIVMKVLGSCSEKLFFLLKFWTDFLSVKEVILSEKKNIRRSAEFMTP